MVKDIPDAATYLKNRLVTDVPLVWLYEVRTKSSTMIRLTSESEIVTFTRAGTPQPYYPSAIKHEGVETTSEGDLPELRITVGNASLEVASILEASDGLVGQQVRLTVVPKSLVDQGESAAISQEADIVTATMTGEALTLRAAARNPFRAGFPPFRYTRRKCRWLYASVECGIDPEMGGGFNITECPGYTLAACKVVGAAVDTAGFDGSFWPQRIGAFPAIPRSRRFS